MSLRHNCHFQQLVASRACQVLRCDHGTVHVVIGDLTLRMTSGDFLQLQRSLGEAVVALTPDTEPRPQLC